MLSVEISRRNHPNFGFRDSEVKRRGNEEETSNIIIDVYLGRGGGDSDMKREGGMTKSE